MSYVFREIHTRQCYCAVFTIFRCHFYSAFRTLHPQNNAIRNSSPPTIAATAGMGTMSNLSVTLNVKC